MGDLPIGHASHRLPYVCFRERLLGPSHPRTRQESQQKNKFLHLSYAFLILFAKIRIKKEKKKP